MFKQCHFLQQCVTFSWLWLMLLQKLTRFRSGVINRRSHLPLTWERYCLPEIWVISDIVSVLFIDTTFRRGSRPGCPVWRTRSNSVGNLHELLENVYNY